VTIGDPATWGGIAEVTSATVIGNQSGLVVHNVVSAPNVKNVSSQVSVSTTSASQLSNGFAENQRRMVKLKNGGASTVYLGSDTVSTTTGYALFAGETEDFEIGPALTIYGIAGSGTNVVYMTQLG
jgi:hypothetical protein